MRKRIMNHLVAIIEQDDIEAFKNHFQPEKWQDTIIQIKNYATKEDAQDDIHYDDADVVKYAVHCNADKIFAYLLPLVNVDKHGENYGWPLLSMAIKNSRYDYANQIISHPTFDPYPMYHRNSFTYIESRKNPQKHIEFLFNFLEHFNKWDFKDRSMIYTFTHLICYDEYTFNRFNSFYQRIMNKTDVSVMDIYQNNMDILADEVFNRKYKKFIIEKLSPEKIKQVIESTSKDKVLFMSLFESEHANEGLTFLLQARETFINYLENDPVMASYLSLKSILLLIDNGWDIWKEDIAGLTAIDYILNSKDLHEEATWYFINTYTHEVLKRQEKRERDGDIKRFCQHKVLNEQLDNKKQKAIARKI